MARSHADWTPRDCMISANAPKPCFTPSGTRPSGARSTWCRSRSNPAPGWRSQLVIAACEKPKRNSAPVSAACTDSAFARPLTDKLPKSRIAAAISAPAPIPASPTCPLWNTFAICNSGHRIVNGFPSFSAIAIAQYRSTLPFRHESVLYSDSPETTKHTFMIPKPNRRVLSRQTPSFEYLPSTNQHEWTGRNASLATLAPQTRPGSSAIRFSDARRPGLCPG